MIAVQQSYTNDRLEKLPRVRRIVLENGRDGEARPRMKAPILEPAVIRHIERRDLLCFDFLLRSLGDEPCERPYSLPRRILMIAVAPNSSQADSVGASVRCRDWPCGRWAGWCRCRGRSRLGSGGHRFGDRRIALARAGLTTTFTGIAGTITVGGTIIELRTG